MNRRADILIDAIGKADEKYIRRSMPMTDIRSDINNEIMEDITMEKTENGLIEITVERPPEKNVRRYKGIRIAAVSGLAAAVAVTGGLLVWNNLGNSQIPTDNNGVNITLPPDVDPDKVIEEANYFPDIRDLKWGMTVEEVKAHETETLSSEENDVRSSDRLQTLLNYENVEYKEYNTTMTLCVDKIDGLNGVNYYIDAETYPDAANTLKDALEKEYGEYDDSYGNYIWSMPEKNLTVVLYDWQISVQVSYFPYIDLSQDSTADTEESGEDQTDDSNLNNYQKYSSVAGSGEIPVYPPAMPGFDEEDFDYSTIDHNGYPRILLMDILMADYDRKYDLHLVAEDVYADPTDKDILYGNMSWAVTENESDEIINFVFIDGLYDCRIDLTKLDDYLGVFNITDDEGKNRTIVKEAYNSETPGYYKTTFAELTDNGSNSTFYSIAGYTNSDPYVSDQEAVGMKLSADLECDGKEIFDYNTGAAFSFNFDTHEVSIRLLETAETQPEETQEPTPAADSESTGPEKIKTFSVGSQNYLRHEPNPGENSPFAADIEIANHIAYVEELRWISTENFLAEAKEDMQYYEGRYESFEAALKPYCDENGGLIYEKAIAVPQTPMGEMFGDVEYYSSSYDYRVIDDTWLIAFNETDAFIHMRDDRMTAIRQDIEHLWSIFDDYPDMTVTAVTDWDTDPMEIYLKIIAESSDLAGIKASLSAACGEAADYCRFVTPEEERATWLPVTMLVQNGDVYNKETVEGYDIYNVAFDNGVYTGVLWGSSSEAADKLREFAMFDEAGTLIKETENIPHTVKDQKEFLKALRENIKSFERIIPYASIFDPIKLPRTYEAGFSCYYSIGSQVLEVMASPSNLRSDEYEVMYRLLQPEANEYHDMSHTRYIVMNFRDNYTFDDPANGYKGYVIRGIEVIKSFEGLKTIMQVRIIADESMWEEIEHINGDGLRLVEGELLFAQEPADTAGMEYWDN